MNKPELSAAVLTFYQVVKSLFDQAAKKTFLYCKTELEIQTHILLNELDIKPEVMWPLMFHTAVWSFLSMHEENIESGTLVSILKAV